MIQVCGLVFFVSQASAVEADWSILKDRTLALYQQKNYDEAFKIIGEALKTGLDAAGSPDAASVFNILGLLQTEKQQFDQAEQSFLKAKKIFDHANPPLMRESLVVMTNLATLYKKQNDLTKATALYQSLYQLRVGLLGADHPDSRFTLLKLIELYEKKGDYKDVITSLESLKVQDQMKLGDHHPQVIQYELRIAANLARAGQNDQAATKYLALDQLVSQKMPKNYHLQADVLLAMGTFYAQIKKWVEAESALLKALKIYAEALGQNHPDVVPVLEQLNFVYQQKGDLKRAQEIAKEIETSENKTKDLLF